MKTPLFTHLATVKQDVFAGMVVFLVALPLCLGVAQASGMPPLAGLLSGIIGGLLITAISPSPLSVSGPAAGMIALVVTSIATLGSISAMLVALILAGALQIAAGLFRLGRLAGLIPGTVIRGLLAGIGILLIVQQIPVAFGYVPDRPAGSEISLHFFHDITGGSVLIMAVSLVLLVLMEMPRFKQSRWSALPAPLVVVLWGIVAQFLLSTSEGWQLPLSQRVQLPDWSWDEAWPLSAPDWSALSQPSLYQIAFSLALLASLETLLSLEATSRIDPLKRAPHSDRELVAQGAGNMVSGLLGGLPLTAVIVRSSANVYAGARTRFSAIFHGLLLALSALLLGPILNTIPFASLSAILIFTGFKLASPSLFIREWRQGKTLFIPFMVTVTGIVGIGLLQGIGLGVLCQLLISVMKAEKNTLTLTQHGSIHLLRIHQNITFISKPELCRLLDSIPNESTVYIEVADGITLAPDLREAIQAFASQAKQRKLTLFLPTMMQ
ncbi:SulP family inorganic anion transporter [Enterobacteriaceae bacterium RIT692]|nr:SulP family inorganic anion transporter [Enterobacteriaceae bacterium RIT692]